jgi:hypothetical protein
MARVKVKVDLRSGDEARVKDELRVDMKPG